MEEENHKHARRKRKLIMMNKRQRRNNLAKGKLNASDNVNKLNTGTIGMSYSGRLGNLTEPLKDITNTQLSTPVQYSNSSSCITIHGNNSLGILNSGKHVLQSVSNSNQSSPLIVDLTTDTMDQSTTSFDNHKGFQSNYISRKAARMNENTMILRSWENNNNVVSKQQTIHSADYADFGDPTLTCKSCGAIMWHGERLRKSNNSSEPSFSLCCMRGKAQLPLLKEPPSLLKELLYNNNAKSRYFCKNIRRFNMMFSFTSMGGKIDTVVNQGRGPYVFRLHGQNYHRIGSLLPTTGCCPKFLQLYIHDTDNEITNRISTVSTHGNSDSYETEIVDELKRMVDDYNPLAQAFRMARDRFEGNDSQNVKLRLIGRRGSDGRRYNLPTASEVAALIVGDISDAYDERDIILETQTGVLKRINELHPSYLPLQYPLLFPYGEDGYRVDIPLGMSSSNSQKRSRLSMREFFAFRIQERANEGHCLIASRKLFQQFLVDSYTMIEAERLSFIRGNQKKLRSETFKNLVEATFQGNTTPASTGKRIMLPSTFTGGPRYMQQNFLDAMALCKTYGYPDLFITFTCNPKWPEITRFLTERGLQTEDRPDILSRVFKMKLEELIKDLKKEEIFGRVQAVIYTVEFQKRGLPHAHILLFMHRDDKFPNSEDIDRIISAELPNKDDFPVLFDMVMSFMIHGPCGAMNMKSPCMRDNKCSKYFPRTFQNTTTVDDDGYPIYRRRDNGIVVDKDGLQLDNRFVVPYNARLLLKYQAHINVEWCNQSRSIKYLFKYINKGNDRVTASVSQSTDDANECNEEVVDEIKKYYDCRYISPCEAVWRIFGFNIQYRYPSVERLSFHLPGEHNVVFEDDDPIDSVINRPGIDYSTFLAWMDCNKKFTTARNLTYVDFPTHFVWKQDIKEWRPRKQGKSIGRIHHVTVGCGELYYLMLLLNKVRGPTCYEDIRTINDVVYPSFKDACYALGLLNDDKEYIQAIEETSFWGNGNYLRLLFVMLLTSGSLTRPEFVWENTWELLSEDIIYKQRRILGIEDLQVTEEQLKNYTLAEIERLLIKNKSSLKEYQNMPFPNEMIINEGNNHLIQQELCYDTVSLQAEVDNLCLSLTNEQRDVYDTIMNAITNGKGGVFFIYGHGGTGKTFIWRTLSAAIRSKGEIVITVASSGIASLLLTGGRTAHSRFSIPINVNEDSTCNIKPGTDLAELLIKAKLIIWDEAPMTNRFCFEALDKSLRDILRSYNHKSLEQPFGGKVVVFGGDFRQILPVIPKGTRQDIVSSTINSSYLWQFCTVLKLTRNMRLEIGGQDENLNDIREFSEWILKVGEGRIGNVDDEEALIEVPDDILINDTDQPLRSIVNCTYPSVQANLEDITYLQQRAILAPTHEVVDIVNEYLLSQLEGEEKIYLSADSISDADKTTHGDDNLYSVDFLNSVKASGLPNHKLCLKVGVPIMLIRNINQAEGLCNGTRLQVKQLGNHIIEARIITGRNIGNRVFIPRMLLCPSDSRLPFKMQRRQFPLILCFAMTINKSQGQSLSHVGLYLPRPVFTHGQLYVAISRVKSKDGLKILITDKEGRTRNTTTNVVYREVFENV